jgi:hypothetical protein
MSQYPNTITGTLASLNYLLASPDCATHWQTACQAYWGAVLAGLPEEKRNRPCPWTVTDLVLALEHIDFMEVHKEGEVIYTWLLETFPTSLGTDATSEIVDEPYPQDPHDA